MKENNKQRGITLIALVVTIIVLLILAAVSVSTLTGDNGILRQANNSKLDNIKGAEKEKIRLDYTDFKARKLTGENVKDDDFVVEGATCTPISTNNNLEGWKIVFTASGNEYNFKLYDESIEDVNKEKTGNTGGKWTDNGDGTFTNGDITLKMGDYVDYDPTLEAKESDLTYQSLETKNGYQNQDFDAREYEDGWRVLGIENGNLKLIMQSVFPDLALYGQNGYINGISELNNICAIFGHGKGAAEAKSMTLEDVENIERNYPEGEKYGEDCLLYIPSWIEGSDWGRKHGE